jgi:HSP20 family molecular chaperone IbpA
VVAATVGTGVLEVHIPKVELAKARKIEIKA